MCPRGQGRPRGLTSDVFDTCSIRILPTTHWPSRSITVNILLSAAVIWIDRLLRLDISVLSLYICTLQLKFNLDLLQSLRQFLSDF